MEAAISKGSQTTTTQTGPPGYIQNAYQGLISNTANLAQTPYTPYTGEGVAPINPQQYAGIGQINQFAQEAQPYYGLAGGYIEGAAQPLTTQQINQYYSPYQQDVINTTQGQFNLMNQTALNNIQGNAAAQGALGGDAPSIAKAAYYQAVLPGQEQQIAGLENQGYAQALGTAAQQFQQNPMAAAYGLGNVGAGSQGAALQGASAVTGAGTLEQQTSQALDQYLYNQYLAQMGYPFALNQYAAGIDTAVGSGAGGTSSTTGPPPSLFASLLGLGVAGAGAYGAYQGPQKTGATGGRIKDYQSGGSPVMPYAGGPSYIPGVGGLTHGPGPPKPPGTPSQQGGASSILGNASQLAGMGKFGQGVGSGLGGLGGDAAVAGDPTAEAEAASAADWTASGADLATLGPGLGDLGVGAAADVGAGVAADAGAAGAADLLPLLLLAAQSGGRINYPGGLALPSKNRINLPMRSGMGMPSFVKGYQEGGMPLGVGSPLDIGREYLANQEAQQAYGSGQQMVDPTSSFEDMGPNSIMAGNTGWLPDQQVITPQDNASAAIERQIRGGLSGAPSRALAFNDEQPTGVGGGYQLPPRLPPSERPQVSPGAKPGFLGASPDFWQSLMAAGLGVMASAQPGVPAGVAIGRGGIEGLQTYGGLKKGEADVEMQARRLDQQAQQEQDRITHETQALAQQKQLHEEMTPFQKAELALKAQEPKTILGPDGNLHTVRKDPDTGGFIDIFTNQPLEAPQGTTPSTKPQPSVPMSGEQKTQVASLDDVPSTRAAVASGKAFNYGGGAPAVSKGMDIPEPADVGGHSAQSLRVDAEYYAATGKLPQLGYGGGPQVGMMNNQYRTAVKNYAAALTASRGIDPQDQAMMWREAPLYGRFVMGADGRATVSLGTAVRHLDTLRGLAEAYQANDIQTVNRLKAVISREFGSNAATNLEAAGRIVGPEIIKALGVAGAGGEREREAAGSAFSTTASPDQMLGAIGTTQQLLGGQLEGKLRQAKAAGLTDEQFKGLIGDRPFEILTHAGTSKAGPTIGGVDKQALDWANANPNDPRARQIKQRLGVP